MEAKQLLQWYVDIGADEAIGDSPVDRTVIVKNIPAEIIPITQKSQIQIPPLSPAPLSPAPLPPSGTIEALKEAQVLAAKAQTLDELKSVLEIFEGISLKRTATQMVFADGVPTARIMLVGEAPGTDEDRAGRPFAGVNGELLDKMLAAIGLSREQNVYITHIVNWRPPGNRAPSESEIAMSLPFVRRHIELINPAILVYIGGGAVKALAETSQSITRIHGRWMDYKSEGLAAPIPSIAIFHPSYLINSPSQKKPAWEDLLMLKEKARELSLYPAPS